MTAFALIVDFRLKAGMREAFRRLIDANARASVAAEPGCRRFDVLEPEADADRLLLYEIYADRAAFEAHLRTPHFAAFDAESGDLVASKSALACELVCEGGG